MRVKDKTGKRFGRLKVLGDSGLRRKCGDIVWGCLCDCGNLTLISTGNLTQHTFSCGCLQRELLYKRGKLLGESRRKYSKIGFKIRNREFVKQYMARGRKELASPYIKNLLTKGNNLSFSDIPPELIQLKRAEITARRLLKRRM